MPGSGAKRCRPQVLAGGQVSPARPGKRRVHERGGGAGKQYGCCSHCCYWHTCRPERRICRLPSRCALFAWSACAGANSSRPPASVAQVAPPARLASQQVLRRKLSKQAPAQQVRCKVHTLARSGRRLCYCRRRRRCRCVRACLLQRWRPADRPDVRQCCRSRPSPGGQMGFYPIRRALAPRRLRGVAGARVRARKPTSAQRRTLINNRSTFQLTPTIVRAAPRANSLSASVCT